MTVLAMHGRGSMMDKYATQLEKECLKHWQNGRQMCQVLSLTGHPCTHAIHKGGSDEGVIDPTLAESVDRFVFFYNICKQRLTDNDSFG